MVISLFNNGHARRLEEVEQKMKLVTDILNEVNKRIRLMDKQIEILRLKEDMTVTQLTALNELVEAIAKRGEQSC